MDVRELAIRASVLKAVENKVKEAQEQTKTELHGHLDRGDRKTASLPDGTKLASISKTNGRKTAQVTNESALVKWVAENHPEEIVESVRESYLRKLLEDAKKHGAGVDTTTGELIPGIDVVEGDPYITVSLADDADALITAHWGHISGAVPELPGGAA